MRSYEAARNLFSFLQHCATALVLVGVLIGYMGGDAALSVGRNAGLMTFVLGAIPGTIMIVAGMFGSALVQMARASVDTAEYAQQSLDVSRQHMELSKQLLEQGKTTAASFASLKAAPPVSTPDPQSAPDQGASYAQQPKMAEHTISPHTSQMAVTGPSAEPTSGVAAITKEEQMPLAPLSSDIVYKDGKYLVGDKPFWSKDEALAHQQTLLLAPVR